MDLTNNTQFKTLWTYDQVADLMTVTFKTFDEVTTLGEIKIEGKRFRSLLDSIVQVAPFYLPGVLDASTREFHETLFVSGVSSTRFVP
jgi:hypothetical protein